MFSSQSIVVFTSIITICVCYQCDRLQTQMSKAPNTNPVYIIDISGNPTSYVPGEVYTITLKNNPNFPSNGRFKDFEIVAESANKDPLQFFNPPSAGNFRLMNPMLTAISTRCRNTVIQTNTVLKPSVQVVWVAPESGSGCVDIKATIVESDESWFEPIGDLNKRLCEEDGQNADVQPTPLEICCACDEAKYEIAFKGMWSRNTHPKLYPVDIWTTKFSDIIGASHQYDKAFWNYGDYASAGLKLLAEEGDTSALETELKEMASNGNIRTIIKARELSYPNITGISYTVFRVDKDNHLVSLVSKITPSPDWIVGVSNLELCLDNCSWVESRVLNLYPWDVGTDAGISYTSPKQELRKQEMIKLIKSNSPNDVNAPFYNEDGEPIKPLARLVITREKLYEKECPANEQSECKTTKWSKWSKCSENCFKKRTRKYKNPDAAQNCRKQLVEKKRCKSEHCTGDDMLEADNPQCETLEWSEWSSCSARCGKGTRTRDRKLKNPQMEEMCTSTELQENEECTGEDEDCSENEETQEEEDCPDVVWEKWSDCSVDCGTGIKKRLRVTVNNNTDEDPPEEGPCSNLKQEETVECYNPSCNLFGEMDTSSQVLVSQGPTGVVVDCVVSQWSIWGSCNTTLPCQRGYRFSSRIIKTHASNGGKPCPKKLLRKKKCISPCPDGRKTHNRDNREETTIITDTTTEESIETRATWGDSTIDNKKVDCVLGPWSRWSPCTKSCGSNAVQIKTRPIQIPPRNGGKECDIRKIERKCKLPLACTSSGRLPIFR